MQEEIDFKVDFWGIVMKVCTCSVIICILRFKNAITLARNIIFSNHKKFRVAGIPLYQKQPKSEIDLGPPFP